MEYVLTTHRLTKKYGKFKSLDELSLHIPKGAIYGLVGKNGAGKTTLIRLICGLQDPTSGDFTLYGVKNSDKAIAKSRRRMGAVVETPAFYSDMTAKENLKMQYAMLCLHHSALLIPPLKAQRQKLHRLLKNQKMLPKQNYMILICR